MKAAHIVRIGLAGWLTMASAASAALIDNYDFSVGFAGDSVTRNPEPFEVGPPTTQSFGPLPGVIGGYRTIAIPGTAPVTVNSLTVSANAFASGNLGFSLNAGGSGSAIITWDANGAGLGGADLTDGGVSNFFTFDILFIDQGNVQLTMTVVDSFNDSATLLISNAVVGVQQFAFGDFVGAVDFSNVEMISLEITGIDSSDLSMGALSTSALIVIPEPATMALSALAGLGAIGLWRRRRRGASAPAPELQDAIRSRSAGRTTRTRIRRKTVRGRRATAIRRVHGSRHAHPTTGPAVRRRVRRHVPAG